MIKVLNKSLLPTDYKTQNNEQNPTKTSRRDTQRVTVGRLVCGEQQMSCAGP
jgi:hypothetical protein